VNKLISLAVGGISIAATIYMRRQFLKFGDWFDGIDLSDDDLQQPDLRPGPWYCYYLGDYLTAHPNETVVRSSPLELHDGSFAWATDSPEWDRGWFEKRGFAFPAQWVPYSQLDGLSIEMRSLGS
jgi:hypothetical protein